MRILLTYIFVFCFLFTSSDLMAQYSEYEVKAAYIKNFTIFIEWPNAQEKQDEPFKILVLGKNPFDTILNNLSSQVKIQNRTLEVEYSRSITNLDCDLLFIAGDMKNNLADILDSVKNKPILTIADTEGFGNMGVHINFFKLDNNVLFEINRENTLRDGFKVSSRLLKLARIVYSGEPQ